MKVKGLTPLIKGEVNVFCRNLFQVALDSHHYQRKLAFTTS
jgi:hypothetical protein